MHSAAELCFSNSTGTLHWPREACSRVGAHLSTNFDPNRKLGPKSRVGVLLRVGAFSRDYVILNSMLCWLSLVYLGTPWWCWLELCIICLLQSVRTFFRKNMDTCLEWLSHVRGHIVSIAIHAGMPAVAIRHGFAALKDLVKLHVCMLCVRVHVSLICSWHHEENQDKC